jgi:OOP family OmpA-OmpF porin
MIQIAHILGNAAPVRIRIEGHTDARGPALFNLDLSLRRACTVADNLRRRLGPDAPEMEIQAFGEARPVAPNIHPDGSDDRAGRRRNRRVIIVIRPPRKLRTAPSNPCHTRP